MNKIIVPSLLILMCITGVSQAYEPVNARVQAMGGAGIALPTDVATVFYNPAGLYLQDRIALDLTLGFGEFGWPENWGVSYLKYVRSARTGAGIGLYRIEDSSLPPGGDAVAAILATVYRTPIGIPLGFSFKYINEKWADEDRKGYFSGDLGIVLPYKSWLLGLNFQSFTDPGSRLFPYRVLCGVSQNLGGKITAALQIGVNDWDDLKNLNQAEYRLGLEARFSRALSLAGGWVQDSTKEKYWTGGMGLYSDGGFARLHLAYHWYPQGTGDDRLFLSYNYYLN